MTMDDCWAIYIDIEGFSALYPKGNDALWALNKLMLAIHRIGKCVYPERPDRLFAHQLGDGFLIVSDSYEENLDRAASIATLLMKFITSFGLFARGSIVEGGLAGITGCYSKEVMNECDKDDCSTSRMGAGLMTIFPVMGMALINAVGVDKRSPKGPLLTLPQNMRGRLSESFITKFVLDTEIVAIDWVHTEDDRMAKIAKKANLVYPCPENLEIWINQYICEHNLPPEWKVSCKTYLGISISNV